MCWSTSLTPSKVFKLLPPDRRALLAISLRAATMALVLGCYGKSVSGQAPTRDDYYQFVPPAGRIVSQREASAKLHLYGDVRDPTYRDVEVVDGIDDRRGRRLAAIAERFSPVLRRNNFSVPREFESALAGRVVLNVDTWINGRRVRSDSIDLGDALTPPRYDGIARRDPIAATHSDSQLRAVLLEFSRGKPSARFVSAEQDVEKILFFDFPGEDEKSWRRAYDIKPRPRSHVYAHFFIREEQESDSDERFELIVQYWMFYPFNDGANNHEGDWEKINVSISTLDRTDALAPPSRIERMQTEHEIRRMLDSSGVPTDSLSVHMVDYYFHHAVMTLDYVRLRVAADQVSSPHSMHTTTHVWEDADFVQQALRRRLALAGGRLATHPFGYIGGNNKGPAELLHLWPRFAGSFDRNSHGTYPFPATWALIGPLGATERIAGSLYPDVKQGAIDGTVPWYDALDDDQFLTYRQDQITLLPDWERIQQLVMDDPSARRRWAWLVLPIYFGFPASESPGAGVVKRTDTGNLAGITPSYKATWNRNSRSAESEAYTPTVLRVAGAPVTPWALLQSGWGALNLVPFAWGLMPGGNVAVTQLLPWATGGLQLFGTPPTRTFVEGHFPPRITSLGVGGYRQFGGRDFAQMLPQRASESTVLASHLGDSLEIDEKSMSRSSGFGTRIWFNLYYGRRWSLENSYGFDTTHLAYRTRRSSDGATKGVVAGRMVLRELTGGIRYNLLAALDESFQLYLRGGYAWTWYRVDNVTVDGTPANMGERPGGYLPALLPFKGWWPNSMYGGAGFEMFAPKRRWLFHRLGYGVRGEFAVLGHRVESRECQRCGKVAERGDAALSVVFGW